MRNHLLLRVTNLIVLLAISMGTGWPAMHSVSGESPSSSAAVYVPTNQIVLKDYRNVITASDLGSNDFADNMGTVNKEDIAYCRTQLVCPQPDTCALQRLSAQASPEPATPPIRIIAEAESGTGDGTIMPRSNASGAKSVLLTNGQSRTVSAHLSASLAYTLQVRYSNDNWGASEILTVVGNGTTLGTFIAQDTGGGGLGWNVFVISPSFGPIGPGSASTSITVSVARGDGRGVELDAVMFDAILCPLYLPFILK